MEGRAGKGKGGKEGERRGGEGDRMEGMGRFASSWNYLWLRPCPLVNMSVTSSANARSLCMLWNCCAITAWATARWGMFTRPLFSVSCCMLLQPGGDSPAQPINNVSRHQYGVLYGPACTQPMILRFLNWLQIWTTTYLHTFGTILTTFCTNFYLIKLITRTVSDHVHILSH